MRTSDAYITIGLDKSGNVVGVQVGGREIEPKQGPDGQLSPGGWAPGCEKVMATLVHELLSCDKKEPKEPPAKPDSKSPGDPQPGSDPCCYRDPRTGRVWCWC